MSLICDGLIAAARKQAHKNVELLADFVAVRAASLHLFRSFAPADWERRGEASGTEVSVRAIAWILAGHELHHRRIVRERYGVGQAGT